MSQHLFVIITVIIFVCPTYPMKNSKNNHPNSCLFQYLSTDILDLIGLFLLHSDNEIETKKEFTNRTLTMIDKNSFFSRPNTGEMTFSAYCPNRDKTALLHISHNEQKTIFCILGKNDRSLYQEKLPAKEYKSIAVSQDGNMFATIHAELEITGNSLDFCTAVPRYTSILTIKKILSPEKTKCFNLHHHFEDPFGFTLPALAFNKQGTLLIVHYHNNNNSSTQQNTPKTVNQHKIFKNVHRSYIDAENSLDKYFAYHHVCRKLTLQLIQNK